MTCEANTADSFILIWWINLKGEKKRACEGEQSEILSCDYVVSEAKRITCVWPMNIVLHTLPSYVQHTVNIMNYVWARFPSKFEFQRTAHRTNSYSCFRVKMNKKKSLLRSSFFSFSQQNEFQRIWANNGWIWNQNAPNGVSFPFDASERAGEKSS